MKSYAFVGSWSMKPGQKGIHIYEYDPETAGLHYLRTLHEESNVGNQYYDKGRRTLYATDEGQNVPGTAAGRILTFRVDPEEGLCDLSVMTTILPKPSAVCLDRSGDFLLIAHHSNRGSVTQAVRSKDGRWTSRTVSDEACLALAGVGEDGIPGEILDCVITRGEDPYGSLHMLSHMHNVTADPSGVLYLVCDKGMDCIYSFRLNHLEKRLELLQKTETPDGSAPRYVVFHPTLPIVYENNERKPLLNTYRYSTQDGKLGLLDTITFTEEMVSAGSTGAAATAAGGFGLPGFTCQLSDLVIHPDGQVLYSSFRGTDSILVLTIDEDGIPHPGQVISCGGVNPRGLCVSPDGRFLLCANIESGDLARFSIQEDGTLRAAGEPVRAHMPANIVIAEL